MIISTRRWIGAAYLFIVMGLAALPAALAAEATESRQGRTVLLVGPTLVGLALLFRVARAVERWGPWLPGLAVLAILFVMLVIASLMPMSPLVWGPLLGVGYASTPVIVSSTPRARAWLVFPSAGVLGISLAHLVAPRLGATLGHRGVLFLALAPLALLFVSFGTLGHDALVVQPLSKREHTRAVATSACTAAASAAFYLLTKG